MFMCFSVYFMVYSSYSNSAVHGLDIHTWVRIYVDCKDVNKDVVKQRTKVAGTHRISPFRYEHGLCAVIRSVDTDDLRNTDPSIWGHKCVNIGQHLRSRYTEMFYNWSLQIIRGHYAIIVEKYLRMNMAINVFIFFTQLRFIIGAYKL